MYLETCDLTLFFGIFIWFYCCYFQLKELLIGGSIPEMPIVLGDKISVVHSQWLFPSFILPTLLLTWMDKPVFVFIIFIFGCTKQENLSWNWTMGKQATVHKRHPKIFDFCPWFFIFLTNLFLTSFSWGKSDWKHFDLWTWAPRLFTGHAT